jgi:hypothetical protein
MTPPINQKDSKGEAHGIWELYWSDDTLWRREHWHHGEPYGLFGSYWKDGTIRWKQYFLKIK